MRGCRLNLHIGVAYIIIVAIAQMPTPMFAQSKDELAVYRNWTVPQWASNVLDRQFWTQYDWYDFVNPFFQRGDFDGDGQADIALLVRQKATGRVGILFVHRAAHAVQIVGAGTSLSNGGNDFKWLGAWHVEDGSALTEVPGFHADVLYVEKPESASALIYWDGRKYQWAQRGD